MLCLIFILTFPLLVVLPPTSVGSSSLICWQQTTNPVTSLSAACTIPAGSTVVVIVNAAGAPTDGLGDSYVQVQQANLGSPSSYTFYTWIAHPSAFSGTFTVTVTSSQNWGFFVVAGVFASAVGSVGQVSPASSGCGNGVTWSSNVSPLKSSGGGGLVAWASEPSGFTGQVSVTYAPYTTSSSLSFTGGGDIFSEVNCGETGTTTWMNIYNMAVTQLSQQSAKCDVVYSSQELFCTSILLQNPTSSPTPNPFQVMVTLNPSLNSSLFGPDLQNLFFYTSNSSLIPSWIESGASATATSTNIWLKLTQSIPAGGNATIYAGLDATSTNLLNPTSIGLAPQLSSTYAQYDDGANVFNYYDNFAGSSLKSSWTVNTGFTATVNNGLTFGVSTAGSWEYMHNSYTVPVSSQMVDAYVQETAADAVAIGTCASGSSISAQYEINDGGGYFQVEDQPLCSSGTLTAFHGGTVALNTYYVLSGLFGSAGAIYSNYQLQASGSTTTTNGAIAIFTYGAVVGNTGTMYWIRSRSNFQQPSVILSNWQAILSYKQTVTTYTTVYVATTVTNNYNAPSSVGNVLVNWSVFMFLNFVPIAFFTIGTFLLLRGAKVQEDRVYLLAFDLVLTALYAMNLLNVMVPFFAWVISLSFLFGGGTAATTDSRDAPADQGDGLT